MTDPFSTMQEALNRVYCVDDHGYQYAGSDAEALVALVSIEERLEERTREIVKRDVRLKQVLRECDEYKEQWADVLSMEFLDYWQTIGKSCSAGEAIKDLLAEREVLREALTFLRDCHDEHDPYCASLMDAMECDCELGIIERALRASSPASEPDEFPITWLRCANCERATTTGLCGCPNPAPQKIGEGVMRVSNQERSPDA